LGASETFIKCNYGSNITHTSGNEGGMGTPCTDAYFVEQKAEWSRFVISEGVPTRRWDLLWASLRATRTDF
jgi:hypothetical protein